MKSDIEIGQPAPQQGHQCHCGCGSDEIPLLKAMELPKAVRHGAIIGALSSLKPGAQMDLVASHDPLPLLAQLDEAMPEAFTREYLDRAEDAVRIRFTRN